MRPSVAGLGAAVYTQITLCRTASKNFDDRITNPDAHMNFIIIVKISYSHKETQELNSIH